MRATPDTATLLDIVADLLRDEIVPVLEGAPSYHARIAAGLVALVARDLRLGPAADAAEGERLRALLGDGGDRALLAEALRTGGLSLDDAAVADHLRATALAAVAIDQPRYARYRQLSEDQ